MKAHLSGPPAMPTARQPHSLASWPTSEPTGPEAAATTTVSPRFGWPISFSPDHAVKPGMPSTPSAEESGARDASSLRIGVPPTPLPSEAACVTHPVGASTMSPLA